MTGRHVHRQRDLARRFPHQVAVPVPATGLGAVLSEMVDWCIQRHGQDGWATFTRSERSPEPREWAVFAFATADEAKDFREAWGESVTLT